MVGFLPLLIMLVIRRGHSDLHGIVPRQVKEAQRHNAMVGPRNQSRWLDGWWLVSAPSGRFTGRIS